jgi:hypothetical protein
VTEEVPAPSRLSIQRLLQEWGCDPFERTVWPDLEGPITREEVALAIAHDDLSLGQVPADQTEVLDRAFHVQRVAWLVINGWNDSISVDVGIPCMGYSPDWPILDGNHRFAAAVYRDDESILANVDGQVDWIAKLSVAA